MHQEVSTMKIRGSVALVTGANRGLGKAFAAALIAGGAHKVYAAARDPDKIEDPKLNRIRLDITNHNDVSAAADLYPDVTLLVNNAGIIRFAPLIASVGMEDARDEMETNYFGTLAMCRAFAPILGKNGGGAIVNVLSVASWVNVPTQGSYSASKAAELSLTNGIRIELEEQGTQVVAVHAGYMDTDMAAHVDAPKSRASDVVERTLEGLEAGSKEVLADERSREIRSALKHHPETVDVTLENMWKARRRS
jgi:NAD(P)-dependent dehydrogenase (short-subunit alcohol dehydrogenase family)